MKSASNSIDIPSGICLACFNGQQCFTFPFVVYCPHGRVLAVIQSKYENATFDCAPGQLQDVKDRLGRLEAAF